MSVVLGYITSNAKPIAGPPFTHPLQPFKAHFTGSTTMQSSPHHYQACIAALLETYRLDVKYNYEVVDHGPESLLGTGTSGIPLVINNFGWNKGLGAEVTKSIESQLDLTHVYTFESPGMGGTWSTNDESKVESTSFFSLEPNKQSKPDHGQSERRSLMTMSYFHHQSRNKWNTDLPLCSRPPWEVTWADAIDRIFLIGSGSEDVATSEVLRALNGGIVALLTVDPAASRGLQRMEAKAIVPYTQGADPPDPSCSNCIGIALVRGVRASLGTLHILTPVAPELLAHVRVLVMGEVKLPIWGMLDFRAEAKDINQIAGVKMTAVPFLHWSEGSDETPLACIYSLVSTDAVHNGQQRPSHVMRRCA